MSFGFSLSDFISLTELTTRTYNNWKTACGDYAETTAQLHSLHLILDRVEREARNPSSVLSRNDGDRKDLKVILSNCKHVVAKLEKVVSNRRSLGMSRKRNWDRIRLAHDGLDDLQSKLTSRTSALSVYLDTIGVSALGRVEGKLDDFKDMKRAFDNMASEIRTGRREGSVMTTYSDDDKGVWRQFRRELIGEGYTSSTIRRFKAELKEYLKRLSEEGLLEEVEPQDYSDENTVKNSKNSLYNLTEESENLNDVPHIETFEEHLEHPEEIPTTWSFETGNFGTGPFGAGCDARQIHANLAGTNHAYQGTLDRDPYTLYKDDGNIDIRDTKKLTLPVVPDPVEFRIRAPKTRIQSRESSKAGPSGSYVLRREVSAPVKTTSVSILLLAGGLGDALQTDHVSELDDDSHGSEDIEQSPDNNTSRAKSKPSNSGNVGKWREEFKFNRTLSETEIVSGSTTCLTPTRRNGQSSLDAENDPKERSSSADIPSKAGHLENGISETEVVTDPSPSDESPMTKEEHMLLDGFELHASGCQRCFNPIKAQFSCINLCEQGCLYAGLISRKLYRDDVHICRKPRQGSTRQKRTPVSVSKALPRSVDLLVALDEDARQGGHFGALYCHDCGRMCRIGDFYGLGVEDKILCGQCLHLRPI